MCFLRQKRPKLYKLLVQMPFKRYIFILGNMIFNIYFIMKKIFFFVKKKKKKKIIKKLFTLIL